MYGEALGLFEVQPRRCASRRSRLRRRTPRQFAFSFSCRPRRRHCADALRAVLPESRRTAPVESGTVGNSPCVSRRERRGMKAQPDSFFEGTIVLTTPHISKPIHVRVKSASGKSTSGQAPHQPEARARAVVASLTLRVGVPGVLSGSSKGLIQAGSKEFVWYFRVQGVPASRGVCACNETKALTFDFWNGRFG